MDATIPATRIAVDIGSTVVKVARIGQGDEIVCQRFWPRDFDAGIARQVETILDEFASRTEQDHALVCSSANGGLRVGIVCLTKHFSGAVFRDQVLLAGANPVFVRDLDEGGDPSRVDLLLVGGGIDSRDAAPLERRLRHFKAEDYRFGSLVYAGNSYLADMFLAMFPTCTVIPNPLGETLSSGTSSVFEALRRAYLDDLIYKEGVSELRSDLARTIRPTPEVVNCGFQRAVLNRSSILTAGPCVLLDIGGATTDLHYTVELVRDDSDVRPSTTATSVARYVFTDLGIVASRDSLLLQMRSHPRLFEFLGAVLPGDVRETYGMLREGDYTPSAELLSYGCLFLGLDRFAQGRGPGLPAADLSRVAHIILTGGAAQTLAEDTVTRVVNLLAPGANTAVLIDRRYQIWVDGITWSGQA